MKGTDVGERDHWLSRFSLLASAITSRRLDVVPNDKGQTYTDGHAIYVDPDSSRDDVRDAVAMQAALLAGGSLTREILVRLSRHRKIVTQRYLSLEAIRLAVALEDRLPPATVARIRGACPAALSASSHQSYKHAASGARVPPPPPWLGTVKVIALLRSGGAYPAGAPTDDDLDREADDLEPELPEDDESDSERSTILDLLSSPLSNPLSDALRKLLGTSRSGDSDGGDGAELPVSGQRAGAVGPKAKRTRLARAIATMFAPTGAGGVRYPEWDDNKRVYRPDWCAVAEYDPPKPEQTVTPNLGAGSLRRPLARVGVEAARHRRQLDGDSLDISGVVDYVTNRRLGDRPDPAIYEQTLTTKRDLSVLILLDATGSTTEESDGRSIFEEERLLAGELAASLDGLGDHVAAYGFYSRGKDSVRFLRIKQFADRFDTAAKRRLYAIAPSGFTRLGAVVRHGAHLLESGAHSKNMVLILIGDGLPYDDGYENSYARADTRRAIQEAVWSGIGVVGLAIRSSVEPEIHEDIWSEVPFRVVQDIDDARKYLRPLLLDALRTTRGNGRRRELLTARDHAQLHSWMAKGRKLNSYV